MAYADQTKDVHRVPTARNHVIGKCTAGKQKLSIQEPLNYRLANLINSIGITGEFSEVLADGRDDLFRCGPADLVSEHLQQFPFLKALA